MKSPAPQRFTISIIFLLLVGSFFAACKHKAEDYEADANFYNKINEDIYRRYNIDNPKETIQYIDSVFASFKNVSNYGHYFRYNRKRDYYLYTNDYKKSDLYADSAIYELELDGLQNHYPEQYAYALLSKGSTAFALHNYSASYDYYYRAINFAKQNLDVCKLKDYSYAVAMTLYSQKKYNESANNFKQAFAEYAICKDNHRDAWHMQEILNNTALCYTKLNQSDSALLYYNKALIYIRNNVASIVTPNDVKKANAVIYGNMGKVYYKKNMLDTAEALLIESINVNLQPYGDHKDAQLEQVQLADLYLKKNELTLLHQTLLALGNEFKKEVAEQAKMAWLMQMSQYYEKTHDGENSIKYFRNYISMRDSVNEVNKLAFTTDILQQLKDKDQQIQIDKLKRANQLSYMYLWITIALALMALTIILLVYNYYRKGKHNIQELMMLNNEVGKQKNKLEFAMVELEKSNSGKDRILNAVAHDLRNPIGGIAMLCTSLIADNKHDEESGALLNMIEKTALDSLNLINELLDSNVPQDNIHLHKHMVDINDLATQCLLLMRLSADKKYQELRLSPLPQSLSVNIDKEKIERVLNNLLSNAIKFSQEGGEINLKLEQKNNAVYIIIKDQGMGIAPEVHSELFNTLTGIRRKGTAGEKSFGLGLSICKQIVEAHNGRIWLDSELGKGATFYVELPL